MNAASASDVQISVLGGVRVEIGVGDPIDPLPRKCQELLAALALDPGAAIPVARLVTLMWGNEPPRTAQKTMQTYVARLRRELGAGAIARIGAAYRLDVDPASIDATRFRTALKAGQIDAALREWGGPPLAGIHSSGLQPLIDRLTEEWLDAIETHLEQAVDVDPGSVVGQLTELTSDHPYREGLCALLMTALYRTDRQAEALETYRRARSLLVEELGVEPGPRLRDLEQLILRHDDELDARVDAGHRRRPSHRAPTGTVTFGFVELDDVAALWSDHAAAAADVIASFVMTVGSLAVDHRGFVFASGTETAGVAFDRAADACAWAEDLHHTIAAATWPHGASVSVRVGLHTGEADERNMTYFGPVVTLARQLATVGSPGQTIATAITATLSSFEHYELGTFLIEGESDERSLHQIGRGSFSQLRTGAASGNRLPEPPHSLLGREPVLADIGAALLDAPVVTLVGPGGIGKTRLAIEVARRRIPDAAQIWFVTLANVTSPDQVSRSLADSLGVTESSDRTLEDAIAAALGRRSSLVVLDNCEHIIDGVAQTVSDLVQQCPMLTILATSREGLGVAGERLIPVGPLNPDQAGVELFLERALALDPRLNLDRKAVQEVCRRLDGVPLAIELAAASSRAFAPSDLIERLDDMFSVLVGGRRRSLDRSRTLHATIQWSYDLLTDTEQSVFRRLGVFSGSFDLHAAESVIASNEIPSRLIGALLSDLVDRSMCLAESGTAGRRFRLLEPMRQFALDATRRADDHDNDLWRRHAEHVRDRVRQIYPLLAGPQEVRGAAELAELWPNIRSALNWAIGDGDLGLAAGLVDSLAAQGFLRRGLGELGDWIERILELAETDHDVIANGLLWTALYAQQTENRDAFDRLVQRCGVPDMPLGLLASSVINGDSHGVLVHAPQAISEALARSDTMLARTIEIIHTGNLVQVGQLREAEAHLLSVLGKTSDTPPTLLSWMMFMAATLQEIQGNGPVDNQLYDQIAGMVLPPRTNSPTPTLAARRAARLGDNRGAFEILREHIDDLLATDSLNGRLIVAVELASLMATTGHLEDAAEILGGLDAASIDNIGGFETLVAETRQRIEVDPTAAGIRSTVALRPSDPRQMLRAMASTLDRHLEDGRN